MVICGIDPGASGGAAIVHDGKVCAIGSFKESIVDTMRKVLLLEPDIFVIEKVGAQTKDGVRSAFSFGRALGQVEGAIGHGEKFYVPPRTWQSWAGVYGCGKGKGTKTKSYQIARLIIDDPNKLKGPKGGIKDGICDAILIAFWYEENIVKKTLK
jgi:hypothetical protein